MSHHHDHSGHHHQAGAFSRPFLIAIALNSAFVVVEFVFGLIAHSTALMADASHNLSDVLSLLLTLGAAILSRKTPSGRYTYGLRSSSILAALTNAMMLMAACGAIAWESVHRFYEPQQVDGLTVTLIAAVGIVINGLSAWLFMRESQHDLNIRSAYLHMATDALVSLGVVIAGAAILYTGFYWLDPLISLVIVVVVAIATWGLLRESLQLALNAVPANIDVAALKDYLGRCPGVAGIHDLHIWGMSTTENALTVHLVMPDGYPGDDYMDDIARTLSERFSIDHSTLQVERGTTDHSCMLHTAH